MKKILSINTILMLYVLQLFAAGSDNTAGINALWASGNVSYQQKQYDSAVIYFERIAALKPNNAEIYYNLGNTYYRMNKIGMAVLNYERALHINPDYREAQDNLLLTQSRIATHIPQANEIFFINWWNSLTRGDRATSWAVWALITFLVIVFVTMLMYFKKTSFTIPGQVPGILGILWLGMLVFAYASADNKNHSHKAVVMQNDTPLMNLEQKSGKPLSLLPEGTTVRINGIKGEFVEVTLPDGRKGWIEQSWLSNV